MSVSTLALDGEGPLPGDWTVRTVRRLEAEGRLLLRNGFSSGDHQLGGDGVPHLRPFNVSRDGRVDLAEIKVIPFKAGLRDYALQVGDVLYNNTNSEELVGKCAYWSTRNGLHVVSNHMTIIRVLDEGSIDSRFVAFFLLWFWRVGLARQVCRRHVNQASIGLERLRDIEIPWPNPHEQRAIAGVLSKLQAAVEVQDCIVATLKELKAATMAKLFREGLRVEPLKQTEVGEIPESWGVVRLGDHCKIASGGTPARGVPEYWDGSIPWVKTAEIDYRLILETEERITEQGLRNSSARVFPAGTLLMAMYGQGVTRGRIAFLGIDAATNQACAAFFPDESLDSKYLYACCSYAYDRIREAGHGANQKNLSAEIIAGLRIPLPPTTQEQTAIGDIVETLNNSCFLAEKRRERYEGLFSSALSVLVSGKIRVRSVSEGRAR